MPIETEEDRIALLADGDPVVIIVGGIETPTTGIFSEPLLGTRVGNVPVDRTDPNVLVLTSVWQTAGAQLGDMINVDGRSWTVVDARPSAGLTELALRAFS